MTFTLDHRLEADTLLVGQFPLSLLLLSRDANYPWFILVPQRDSITEIYQLSDADQIQLTRESSIVAQALTDTFGAQKINVAALGNMVAQLHVHHIARFTDDAAWPGPIWGVVPVAGYPEGELDKAAEKMAQALAATGFKSALPIAT